MALSKDQIKAAQDLPREELQIPEWGGSVYVRTLTGEERDRFEAARTAHKGRNVRVNLENFRAALAIASCVNEEGAPIFQESDLDWLKGKSGKALGRIFDVATRLSGLTQEDIEELTKN